MPTSILLLDIRRLLKINNGGYVWRKTLDRLVLRGWVDADKKPTAEGLLIIQTQLQAISPMIDSDRHILKMYKNKRKRK